MGRASARHPRRGHTEHSNETPGAPNASSDRDRERDRDDTRSDAPRPEPDAPPPGRDAVILAVAHRDFVETGATGIRRWAKPKSILYDVKSVLPVDAVDGRL